MMTYNRVIRSAKAIVVSATLILTLMQCTEDEIVAQETSIEKDLTTQMTAETAQVGSLSVSGLFTEVAGDVTCASCSYVVDPSETTVDGSALGLKPGSVVCLRKALKYSSVEFVNMEGSADDPIIIGYCSE